jgi:hypothetical protein
MILDEKNSSPTIEDALQLVDGKAETFESWKLKGLGLRLVLLGLSEVQALRLSKLAGLVYKIEENLLDPKKLTELEPKQLFQLYQLSTKALAESSEFVERTLKATDWSNLETELITVKAKEASANNQSGLDANTAQELLSAFAKMQAQSSESNE